MGEKHTRVSDEEAKKKAPRRVLDVHNWGLFSAADEVKLMRRRIKKKAGDVLLSHTVTHAVPSTQKSLTSEFGMGSGVASSLLSPARLKEAIDSGSEPFVPKGWGGD